MSERDQTPHAGGYPAAGRTGQEETQVVHPAPGAWRENTTPGIEPVTGSTAYPSSGAHGPASGHENYYTTPQYSTTPVALRRADSFGAFLLLLAGIAAGVSLLLDWADDASGKGQSGWDLVREGLNRLSDKGLGNVISSGFWQPLVIVFGGGVLFLIGLLLLVPARAHRFLGLVALLVSLVVTAGVLVPLAKASWHLSDFGLGFWFAIAVAVLGLLGSLKALLTGPKLGTAAPTP